MFKSQEEYMWKQGELVKVNVLFFRDIFTPI